MFFFTNPLVCVFSCSLLYRYHISGLFSSVHRYLPKTDFYASYLLFPLHESISWDPFIIMSQYLQSKNLLALVKNATHITAGSQLSVCHFFISFCIIFVSFSLFLERLVSIPFVMHVIHIVYMNRTEQYYQCFNYDNIYQESEYA